MNESQRVRVAVVFGGRSNEHGVSCVSAGSVLAALDPDEFEVVPIGITREGAWVVPSIDAARLVVDSGTMPEVTNDSGQAVVLPPDPSTGARRAVAQHGGQQALAAVDVVLPLLHGAFGEDGTIQGLLEMAGKPYVGAGVGASAVCMDKEFSKSLLTAAGLPVGPYVVVRPGAQLSDADRAAVTLPAFVKPARGGSSLGISKIESWSAFDAALAAAREVDQKVLVETAMAGVREVECGVLEGEHDGSPEASIPAEIRLVRGDHDWYDFDAKYLDGACEYDIPPTLPDRVVARVRELACRAFDALDCDGLARVDFFVTSDLDVYVNEVNTMPGFTSTSMFPRVWAATGLEYPKLLTRMLRTALARRS